MKKIAGVMAMVLLAGCSGYSLQELRYTKPNGSEFNQSLVMRYLDFAEAQAKAYDWADAARFADKGLLAAYDSEVGPEEVKDYAITSELVPVFEKARADLLALLTEKNMRQRPAVAADALFYFDCWLEQQEENAPADEIAYCKNHFNDRIAELADTSYEKILREQGELGPEVETTSYIVFFAWGQTTLTEAADTVIDDVVKTLEPKEKYEVVLNGHTDMSGDAKYNLRLSKRRAEAVKTRLVENGVNEAAIKIFAYGESDPAVKTADGVNEPKNRRVEIFLGE